MSSEGDMKNKILFMALLLLIMISCPVYAQTWTNVTSPLPWAVSNDYVESMAVYSGNLYVGTINDTTGPEVWMYDGTTWTNVTNPLPWATSNTEAYSMAV
jgi:hypothetical protein